MTARLPERRCAGSGLLKNSQPLRVTRVRLKQEGEATPEDRSSTRTASRSAMTSTHHSTRIKRPEWACKPGLVGSDHFSARTVARPLQQPTRRYNGPDKPVPRRAATSFCLALLRVGFTLPVESPRTAVRSYRTISPLPDPRRTSAIGGLFSVALSLASRSVGVTDHPCPAEPGLSSTTFPEGLSPRSLSPLRLSGLLGERAKR